MKEIRVPSDVICALFRNYMAGRYIKVDIPKLSKIIYDLQQSDYQYLFRDLIFDTYQSYPKCKTISYVFDRMFISGIFVLDSLDRIYICKNLKLPKYLFDKKELGLMNKAAKEIYKQIKIA